jgi:hypothetical protein
MTPEHAVLAVDLLQRAVDGTDDPARAVSVLMSSAMTILQRHYGAEPAIELMQQALDSAGAEWRSATTR